MQKKSLFYRYFNACATIILISITFLGVVFFVFVSQFFKDDKYQLLAQQLTQAVILTQGDLTYSSDGVFYVTSLLEDYYQVIGQSINANIFFVDLGGNVVLSSMVSEPLPHGSYVPASVMDVFNTNDFYAETGKLGGLFEQSHHTVGKPIVDPSNRVVGIIFASTSTEALNLFLLEIFQMFLISVAVMMLFSFIVIFFITSSMIKPLQDMVTATHSFAKGDFSTRVPVEGDDEVAILADSFNTMASELAILEQTRRNFTANVSHELKTPMTSIGGFIDGMLDGTIPPEKHNHYLRIVSTEVQRLARLVRSMLNIARMEAGEATVNLATVNISDLVTQTTLMFEQKITDKNLEVKGLDTEKHMVEADADLIHQVVYNLIDNAVKFADENGELSCRYYEENGSTFVAIRNSGAGLSSEEISCVFDRFYKTDKSRGLDKNGVGLGLYIAKTIVTLHDGEIFIKSELGEYTEFIFSLPSVNTRQAKNQKFKKFDKESKDSREASESKSSKNQLETAE